MSGGNFCARMKSASKLVVRACSMVMSPMVPIRWNKDAIYRGIRLPFLGTAIAAATTLSVCQR